MSAIPRLSALGPEGHSWPPKARRSNDWNIASALMTARPDSVWVDSLTSLRGLSLLSFYLNWLAEHAGKTGFRVHAYGLMTNHVHLLITAERAQAAGALMKALGQRYVQNVNRTYRRSGTLWEGRFRSCPLQAEAYLLACQRYVELDPVRTDMVAHPAEYRRSSYRANAQGETDALVKPHPCHTALGLDAQGRQAAYRDHFRYE